MVNKTLKIVGISVFVLLCAILTFVLRLAPINYFAGTGDMLGAPDSWYNLRLVEYWLQNGEPLNFDPLTSYGEGSIVNWGVIYTGLSMLFSIVAGAVTRAEIIDAVSWVSPVLAAVCTVVVFFIGKKLLDWKAGLISALFMAIIGGQYFLRSIYGLFDHHVAEVLFSCLFCLVYLLALSYTKNKVDFKTPSSLKIPLVFGILSGLAYLSGLLAMTTLVVFGLFVMLFTAVQFVVNYHRGVSSDYLVLLNGCTFLVAVIGLLIYGVRLPELPLYGYSTGLILVQVLAIAGILVLYGVSKIKCISKTWMYVAVLVGIAVICSVACAIINMDIFNMVFENLVHQFTPATDGIMTVQEARAWSFANAFSSFNAGVFIAFIGLFYLISKMIKTHNVEYHFILWWVIGTFVFACAQLRWEYYFAPMVAILSGLIVTAGINTLIGEIKKIKPYAQSKKNKKAPRVSRPNDFYIVISCVIILFGGVFAGVSLSNDIYLGDIYAQTGNTPAYWIDACEWLGENTPDTGIEPYGKYDKETFVYPEESYSVIAWWDFGHYINVIGNRIPRANPFQQNVNDVAEILMSTDETETLELMDKYNGKYVMIDTNTANSFIPVMAVWLEKTLKTEGDAYRTLSFRLFNMLGTENANYGIKASKHFRLIYESPEIENGQTCKIFELVEGAVIKGNGVITCTIESNGNSKKYTQTSENGEFIVPYATGQNGEVTVSAYTTDYGATYVVTENEVKNGLTV